MPFTRTETVLQAPITLDNYVAALKVAFSRLADCVLFDEYEDTTRRYLVFRIDYSNATFGKAFIRLHITKTTLATIHSISTGWDTVAKVVGANHYDSSTSTSMTPTLTEAIYIQTFDQANKEGKVVALTQQVAARNFMVFVGYPQQYRDPNVDNQNTKFIFFTNSNHNGSSFMYPNNNAILPYSGYPTLSSQPGLIAAENPSGNLSQFVTGISLFPVSGSNLAAVVAGIFSDDICLCNGNSNNAGSRYTSSAGSYFLTSKNSGQVLGIRC